MKQMKARYAGSCNNTQLSGCSGKVKRGDQIIYDGPGQVWHPGCGPTGVDPKADQEYMAGMVQADNYRFTRNLLGEQAAIDEEYANEMRFGDGY
jgi:hypothetical protein